MLGESHITVSGGVTLDGISQGDGSHLIGRSITLNSASWQETLINDDDANFADNDGNQTLSGTQTIDGITYVNGTRVEAEYTLVLRNPATGQTWTVIGYNVNNSNPAFGTIEGLAFIGPPAGWPPVGMALQVVSTSEGPANSNTGSTRYASYVTPPCFTPGTLILTPGGETPVERLQAGDLVTTLDHGPLAIRYIARTVLSPQRLRAEPHLAPHCLPRGSLGPALPRRDLYISPQHAMMLAGPSCEMLLGCPEVLAPARHLEATRQVSPDRTRWGVTYIHLLFDDHQIIFAEGAATESYRLGPTVFHGAPPEVQAELLRLFPNPATPDHPRWHRAARPILKPWEAKALAA